MPHDVSGPLPIERSTTLVFEDGKRLTERWFFNRGYMTTNTAP